MEYLIVLALLFGPSQKTPDEKLADFSRFAAAEGTNIALVDQEGTVREGLLLSTTADAVTMKFGRGERVFERSAIASAERLRDNSRDGAIKGALFGSLLGLVMAGAYSTGNDAEIFLTHVALYGGIGWALDAAQTHRQPIYLAKPQPPAPAVKLALRF